MGSDNEEQGKRFIFRDTLVGPTANYTNSTSARSFSHLFYHSHASKASPHCHGELHTKNIHGSSTERPELPRRDKSSGLISHLKRLPQPPPSRSRLALNLAAALFLQTASPSPRQTSAHSRLHRSLCLAEVSRERLSVSSKPTHIKYAGPVRKG